MSNSIDAGGDRALLEAAHTPGPWHIRSIDGSQWTIDDEGNNSIGQSFQIRPLKDDMKQVERTANAQLIAAAPDLLAALQALVERGTDSPEHMAAERAIAKALGTSPLPSALD